MFMYFLSFSHWFLWPWHVSRTLGFPANIFQTQHILHHRIFMSTGMVSLQTAADIPVHRPVVGGLVSQPVSREPCRHLLGLARFILGLGNYKRHRSTKLVATRILGPQRNRGSAFLLAEKGWGFKKWHSGICVFSYFVSQSVSTKQWRVCPVPRPEARASRSVGKMTIHGAANRENGNLTLKVPREKKKR